MKKLRLFALLLPPMAFAYEVDTHALMTQGAFQGSMLTTDATLFQRLGFDRLPTTAPFQASWQQDCTANAILPGKTAYADALGNWSGTDFSSDLRFRCTENYEKLVMPPRYSGRIPPDSLGATPELRFESWLMRGVIREDDLKATSYANPADAPLPGPWEDIDRPRYHFYSPVTNDSDAAFTSSALPWALGVADPFASSAPDPMRGNHFSYADAVDFYLRALTFKSANATATENANARLSFWATSLKSLGHTIHLLQDTASPQHARGEPHNYVCRGAFRFLNQDVATRTYENFTNFRVTSPFNRTVAEQSGSNFYVATNSCEEQRWIDLFAEAGVATAPTSLPFTSSSYPIPQFTLAHRYFTTRVVGDPTLPELLPLATLNARAGLADYSNRGFYTQDYRQGRYLSPPDPSAIGLVQQADSNLQFIPGLGTLRVRTLFWKVPDPVAPSFADTGLDTQGRAPIGTLSYWSKLGFDPDLVLSLANYTQMGDMLGPRAIAYSAGLINFFFRGKLEVTPTAQNVFAVMNQGEPHTVDAQGYPRRADNRIFGFEKVRLKVRNVTEAITESGLGGSPVPQSSGAGVLLAIARYHCNACYRPDMTGQRIAAYAPPPATIGTITEPSCLLPTRTEYQEISVSAPIVVSSESDLPGGIGTSGPAAVEKMFDFSADPIPVNATDLFIQVVYRGQLGEESKGVAVGIYDVREPAFVGIWNNTDYYWSSTSSIWLAQNGSAQYGFENVDFLRVCVGAGADSRWAYFAEPVLGLPPLGIPSPTPGSVRLAVLHAIPNGAQQFAVRVTPATTPPSPAQRSVFTRGAIQQASHEVIANGVLNAPQNCSISPPASGTTYWCNDPIQKRRGMNLGHVLAPICFDTGSGVTGSDVDSVPLPPFNGQRLHEMGTLKYNEATLSSCPPPPSLMEQQAGRLAVDEVTDILEMAADEGLLPVDAAGVSRW